jgi:hypothetical protein
MQKVIIFFIYAAVYFVALILVEKAFGEMEMSDSYFMKTGVQAFIFAGVMLAFNIYRTKRKKDN